MKLLVVGGGGREHAIIKSLKKNPEVTEIFAAPGNGGIAKDATCVAIGATEIEKIKHVNDIRMMQFHQNLSFSLKSFSQSRISANSKFFYNNISF